MNYSMNNTGGLLTDSLWLIQNTLYLSIIIKFTKYQLNFYYPNGMSKAYILSSV